MSKRIYVALDLHPTKIVAMWGEVSEKSKPRKTTLPGDSKGWEDLRKQVGAHEEIYAVYEASSCGFVPYDRMTEWGWKAFVLAPTKIRRSTRDEKRKNDGGDTKLLWEQLVAHFELGTELPVVWVPPKKTREDRELVRHRVWLGEEVTRIKTKIRSLLLLHGIEEPVDGAKWTKKHRAWLRGLGKDERVGAEVQQVLGSLLRLLEATEKEGKTASREVEVLAESADYRNQVPAARRTKGIGVLTAMVMATELGDVTRFRNRKQVGSYLGVTPTSYESGEANDRKGHISREGSWRIRKMLNQCAWAYIRTHETERKWYDQLAERKGPKKAVVAVMRRLGIVVWHHMVEAVLAERAHAKAPPSVAPPAA